MNLKEFFNVIEFFHLQHTNYQRDDADKVNVGIEVFALQTCGTRIVPIKNIALGFDWNRNKLIITPEVDLREINRDEIQDLINNHEDLGRSELLIRQLKSENSKLKKQLLENNSEKENSDTKITVQEFSKLKKQNADLTKKLETAIVKQLEITKQYQELKQKMAEI